MRRSKSSWRKLAVRVGELGPVAELDADCRQLRRERLQQQRLLATHHLLERPTHIGQQLVGSAAVEGPRGDAGRHLAPQTRHLDLEEFVDPLGEEDQELDPLEQWEVRFGHQVEQPIVEVEVGQLAGEVAGPRPGVGPGRRHTLGFFAHVPTLASGPVGPAAERSRNGASRYRGRRRVGQNGPDGSPRKAQSS